MRTSFMAGGGGLVIAFICAAALIWAPLLAAVLRGNVCAFGSSEVAAWVQAIGSIGAILAAIQIAAGQHRRDLDLRLAQAADPIQMRSAICARAHEAITDCIDSLVERLPMGGSLLVVDKAKAEKVEQALARFATAMKAVNGIQLATLARPIEIEALDEVQFALGKADGLLKLLEGPGCGHKVVDDLRDLVRILSRRATQLADLAATIRHGEVATLTRRD